MRSKQGVLLEITYLMKIGGILISLFVIELLTIESFGFEHFRYKIEC